MEYSVKFIMNNGDLIVISDLDKKKLDEIVESMSPLGKSRDFLNLSEYHFINLRNVNEVKIEEIDNLIDLNDFEDVDVKKEENRGW